ncbi:ATP-dependent RNA helicase DbpA [Pseudomonas sp. G11-1]|uniref:ATP-dependent RNA helicase DbpA n=1 Tax=Halopseudomonas bauzanensis TaxID=653930 RepID=A0A1H9NVB4_9GAMM|nr:ATP-dependent RNA helicase DbpA [Halopseudomonas bauzanensis]MCO5785629.1 ATP-dependent RNA helicase DbpA [Pseudomonas sp. G11-1]MCO5788267.1 ATP-dependent RNA helicase DbpA [Pseudomonas sp. G11-2]TKA93312.1 ATP-dependent RNA helicase DbpA [Halopseudomonas bauzanensis]SER39727.1 ATP-dependent RNA helicase DbpA [Halopseudomonas bauzanensis]SFL78179.1 ATP-independent RNA helicase DbpA [Halopseudomonas bauzanensis]
MTTSAFSSLPLPPSLLATIDRLGYQSMTPVQSAALPIILAGQDLIARSRTGSGKTAAFGIGLLAPLNPAFFGCQALVLSPTRELAGQTATALRTLAGGIPNIKIITLCGGTPFGPQAASLEQGVHVIVGTPGRVKDHLERGTLSLDKLNCLVLDEADRMLDMGFIDSISEIIQATPERRQTLLFSATYPPGIEQLAGRFLREPQQVVIEDVEVRNPIRQRFYEVSAEERLPAVLRLLADERPQPCIVFCHTRQQCQQLQQLLSSNGVSAQALHGDMEQRERDQVLALFANQSCSVLVATDVAARGIDVEGVAAVINAELSPDPAVHTHRIGRSGRAGQPGLALSLVAPAEQGRARSIEQKLGEPLPWCELDQLPERLDKPLLAPMRTLAIAGGRKDKVRPGDLLGALTGDAGLPGDAIGKISISDFQALVAVRWELANTALERLEEGKIKGRRFKIRLL